MNEHSLLGTGFRSLIYVFVAGLLIAIMIMPNIAETVDLTSQSGFRPIFDHAVFAWTAAFIHRRPGAANLFVIGFIAMVFLAYTADGIALGSLSLFIMAVILHRLRSFTITQSFAIECVIAAICYCGILISRNFVLYISGAHYYSASQLFGLSIGFISAYLVFNLFIRVFLRSRKERVKSSA